MRKKLIEATLYKKFSFEQKLHNVTFFTFYTIIFQNGANKYSMKIITVLSSFLLVENFFMEDYQV